MKDLKEYIKESILGDWEDIDIKNDAIESVINSYEFKKVFNYYMGYIEYDYKTDTLMCTAAEIEYLNGKTLMDYLPSVKNIYAKNHIYIDIDNIKDGMVPPNIESGQLIRLSDKNSGKGLVIENIPQLVLDCKSCVMNNLKEIHDTTIIGGGDKTRLFMYCHKLPKFNNFVAKKFHKIIIYSPSLNKDISVTSIFNKYMKKDHIVKYYDCKLNKYCEANVKNWEKVVSLTNNNKRYILESPIFEFEHNCDLLKELGLDKVDTNYICISDNNVCCIFHKKESYEELLQKNLYVLSSDYKYKTTSMKDYYVTIIKKK